MSDWTRARMLGAIDETGYSQDRVASAPRRSKTDSVGLVIADTGQPVLADMVRGVEHAARSAGFTLLLSNSAESRNREAVSVQALRERRDD